MSAASHVSVGIMLVAPQLGALLFTLSRSPWVALTAALLAFLVLTARIVGRQAAIRLAVIVSAALTLSLAFAFAPAGHAENTVVTRAASVAPEVPGGLGARYETWRIAIDAWARTPWYDTHEYGASDIEGAPELSLSSLRPLIGYGPDMFQAAFLAANENPGSTSVTNHGHNFLIHTLVELGLLGVAAYLALLATVAATAISLLRAARQGTMHPLLAAVSIGIAATLVGRVIEQSTGKAQVSHLMLSWVLAGLISALANLKSAEIPAPPSPNSRIPVVDAMPTNDLKAPFSPARTIRARALTWRQRNVHSTARGGRGHSPAKRDSTQHRSGLSRLGIAAMLEITVAGVWWQSTAMNVAAAFAAAGAVATMDDGERAQGLARLGDAANQAWPAAPLYRVRLSAFWGTTALRQDDEALRRELLVRAYSEAEEALRWNPFDHRALSQAAFTARELARISPAHVPDAIAAHLRWTDRMPDFGQPLVELGRTYLIFDEPAHALEALEAAISVTMDQPTLNLAHELQALGARRTGARRTGTPLTEG